MNAVLPFASDLLVISKHLRGITKLLECDPPSPPRNA